MPESIFDDLDRLGPRDLAVARYAKNHELLSMVFDARRIDTLTPAPSPYAQVKAEDLHAKVQLIQNEMEQLDKDHALKLNQLRQSCGAGKNAHKGHAQSADEPADVPAWGENASRGKILGVGYVRAETPEELRPPKPVAEAAGAGADEQMEPAVSSTSDADKEAAEAKQAERRQAEKEAIEKLNLELGVTRVEPEVAAPAPAPEHAATTPAPAPAASAATATATATDDASSADAGAASTEPAPTTAPAGEQESNPTEINPPVAAAEQPPAAPVLAPAEVATEPSSTAAPAAVEERVAAKPDAADAPAESTRVPTFDNTSSESATITAADTASAVEAVASQPEALDDAAMLDQPVAPTEAAEQPDQVGADAATQDDVVAVVAETAPEAVVEAGGDEAEA